MITKGLYDNNNKRVSDFEICRSHYHYYYRLVLNNHTMMVKALHIQLGSSHS